MNYHRRHMDQRVSRLAGRFPVVVVAGARQTGKSTLLKHLFGAVARTVVFDPVTDVGNARRDPELFLKLNPPPLILDEIQYAPELLPVLKRVVDADPDRMGGWFVTGSQQLSVLSAVRESLAGRAVLFDLWPMSRGELIDEPDTGLLHHLYREPVPNDAQALFKRLSAAPLPPTPPGTLLERLFRGGYPGLLPFATVDVPAWFEAYIRTYIERDVPALRRLESPQDFSRFFRLMAALTAQEVNSAQLGREIGMSPKTARAWLQALVASFQVFELPAWSGNAVKRVSGRTKAHLVDSGLGCALATLSSHHALAHQPLLGALFESHVVLEIRKQTAGMDVPPRFWHWRTSAGAEVDLLLERDGAFCPIEVKFKSRPSRRDTSGLRAFANTYPGLRMGPRIVVHGGDELALLDEQTVAVPIDRL